MNHSPLFAAVDIGTNSTLLVIAGYDGNRFHPVYNAAEITRLGQAVDSSGELHPDAMERTLAVLHQYTEICRDHSVETVAVGGTSALRDAANGEDFLRRIQNEIGWTVQILTGDDEARLIYLATGYEFDDLDTELLVVDIGGGSTEFIAGVDGNITFLRSLDIGTVRFTEKYLNTDPPDSEKLARSREVIRGELHAQLADLRLSAMETTLIGVAGTVTTLLAVEKGLTEYDPGKIHRKVLTDEAIDELLTLFCSMPLDERKDLPGLQPQRADVIIMGTVILQEVMRNHGFTRLLVSDRGVRYGLLYKEIIEKGPFRGP